MKDFPHYVAMPIQDVMNNPSEYIIPENLRIIEYLWKMNILTEQTNDYENEDSWVAIGQLSKENEAIFNELANNRELLNKDNPGILMHHGVGFRVPIKPGTKDTFDDFLPLINKLQIQDVQKDGYMTIDEFFANYTDCWKVIENPYLELEPKIENYENVMDYLEAANDYKRMRYPKAKFIKVYDKTKAVKSIEEYLKDAQLLDCYDEEEGKIFYNRRLYEGHVFYKENFKNEDLSENIHQVK